MSHLPPLLPTPPSSLKLRGQGLVGVGAHALKRRLGEQPIHRRRAELPLAKRPRGELQLQAAERRGAEAAAVREEGEVTDTDESFTGINCKRVETSAAAAEWTVDPAIREAGQNLDSEKMKRKSQNEHKTPSRSARRKKLRRQLWSKAINEAMEMKRDQLLENIKKLRACIWLLEKEGADMAEIIKFRGLLESTEKQYAENEAQLATKGSDASNEGLNKDKYEKMDTIKSRGEEMGPNFAAESSQNVLLEDLKDQRAEAAEKVNPMIREHGQNLDDDKAEEKSKNGCQMTSSFAQVNPVIREDGHNLDNEEMERNNESDFKAPSRSARRKKLKRLLRAKARTDEMEEGTDMAEINNFKGLLGSAEKQYAEVQLTTKESNPSNVMLSKDEEDKVDNSKSCGEKGMEAAAEFSQDMLSEDFSDQAALEPKDIMEEVHCLKTELQLVRQDRDYQSARMQSLMAALDQQKEISRKYAVELDNAMNRVIALEEGSMSQRETIKTLHFQLASANKKLKELNCEGEMST